MMSRRTGHPKELGSSIRLSLRWSYSSPLSARMFPDVSGPGAYERVALVLLYGVADPTDCPAEGEERDGPARRKPQRSCDRRQREVHRGTLTHQVHYLFNDGLGERYGWTPRIRFSRQA